MWHHPGSGPLLSFRNDRYEPLQKSNIVIRRGPNNQEFYEYVPSKAASRATRQHPHGHTLYDLQAEKDAIEDVIKARVISANTLRREREMLKAQQRRWAKERYERQRLRQGGQVDLERERTEVDRHGRRRAREENNVREEGVINRDEPQRRRTAPSAAPGARPDDPGSLIPGPSRKKRSPAPSPSPPPPKTADGSRKRPSDNQDDGNDSESDRSTDPDGGDQRVLTGPRKRRRRDETSYYCCARNCGWIFSLLDWVKPLPQEPGAIEKKRGAKKDRRTKGRKRDGRATDRRGKSSGDGGPEEDDLPRLEPDPGPRDLPSRANWPPAPTAASDTSSDEDVIRRRGRADSDTLLRPSTPDELNHYDVVTPAVSKLDHQRRREDAKKPLPNERNQTVNERGQLVDAQGRLLNSRGQFIDAQGRLLNSYGQFINEKGQLVDMHGRTRYDAFKDLSDNHAVERRYVQRPGPARPLAPPTKESQSLIKKTEGRRPPGSERPIQQQDRPDHPSTSSVPNTGVESRTPVEAPKRNGNNGLTDSDRRRHALQAELAAELATQMANEARRTGFGEDLGGLYIRDIETAHLRKQAERYKEERRIYKSWIDSLPQTDQQQRAKMNNEMKERQEAQGKPRVEKPRRRVEVNDPNRERQGYNFKASKTSTDPWETGPPQKTMRKPAMNIGSSGGKMSTFTRKSYDVTKGERKLKEGNPEPNSGEAHSRRDQNPNKNSFSYLQKAGLFDNSIDTIKFANQPYPKKSGIRRGGKALIDTDSEPDMKTSLDEHYNSPIITRPPRAQGSDARAPHRRPLPGAIDGSTASGSRGQAHQGTRGSPGPLEFLDDDDDVENQDCTDDSMGDEEFFKALAAGRFDS